MRLEEPTAEGMAFADAALALLMLRELTKEEIRELLNEILEDA